MWWSWYSSLAGFHVWLCPCKLLHRYVSISWCQYPSYEKLNANIKDEAEKVVKRLRNHPSVVIFAGNNEDYQVAESMGVIDYSDESGDYMHSKFPAWVSLLYRCDVSWWSDDRFMRLFCPRWSRGCRPFSTIDHHRTEGLIRKTRPLGICINGMSGTGRRNLGPIGISWKVDLSRESPFADMMFDCSNGQVSLVCKVIPTSEQ